MFSSHLSGDHVKLVLIAKVTSVGSDEPVQMPEPTLFAHTI